MTFKSIIITAVWSGNSFYQCQLFPFVVDYCIPASLQLKKKKNNQAMCYMNREIN